MKKSPRIFLYGPQTSGKTTRLLRIVKRDHGRDILMSGEDKTRVNNGHEVCDVTLRVPKNRAEWVKFKSQAKKQFPVKHVLIDGAQFLNRSILIKLAKIFNEIDSSVPIIYSGCRYYVSTANTPGQEIPGSRFLMNWCDRTILVDRKCDFCHRIATRLYIKGFKQLSPTKIVTVDPHLVCNRHYRVLLKETSKN